MCFVKTPDYTPPEIQQPATIVDNAVQGARDQQIQRARAAAGSQSTILTQSNRAPTTTNKTLLGQ